MFKVKNINTDKVYTVYSVHECVGDTWFLIYIDENDVGWSWAHQSSYVPYEEPLKVAEPTYVPIPFPYVSPTISPNDDWWRKVTWTAQSQTTSKTAE